VTLHGARPDVRDLLAGADLFVQPSVRDEGCSNALLEAMAAGLPAVVTACGGLPETVVEGATGRVVPIGDPERLAAALRELLADAPLRARFGAAARARALEHYSPDAVAASWEALFAELSP
jgi:glycosyltransferase involved in cell wall biosynthesis